MADLYITDEKGRNVYYVHKMNMPSSSEIRTVKYDFGASGYVMAFVAKDCLSALGYKDKETNNPLYEYVSPINIINGKDTEANVYIQIDEYNVEPAVLITLSGFFELVMKSNTTEALIFQHWVNNEVLPALYGYNVAINIHHNGGKV